MIGSRVFPQRITNSCLGMLAVSILLAGCDWPGSAEKPSSYEYTFFVAGHAYGTPDAPVEGMFPPLLRMASALSSIISIELGVLTGDITRDGTTREWDIVEEELQQFKMPVYKVMGNHDARDRAVWTERFGPADYSFKHRSDLFIMLDTNNPNWDVTGEQLAFLKAALSNEGPAARNIFVFCHQQIWAAADGPYADIDINAEPQRPETNNFWNEVLPLLQSSSKPTLLFSGDMGAWEANANHMYAVHENVSLLGTGVGDTVDDDILIVNVPRQSAPEIQLLNLQSGDLIDAPRTAN